MSEFGTSLSRVAGDDDQTWRWLLGEISRIACRVPNGGRLCEADRRDLVQTVALIILERSPVCDPERLSGWLATTLGRQALRMCARRDRQGRDDTDGYSAVSPRADGCCPETFTLVGERDRVLWLAATRLPSPRARHLVWLLAFRPELTQHQMARELGIAVGSVGPLRRRSLDTLRRQLRAHGYRTSDPHC